MKSGAGVRGKERIKVGERRRGRKRRFMVEKEERSGLKVQVANVQGRMRNKIYVSISGIGREDYEATRIEREVYIDTNSGRREYPEYLDVELRLKLSLSRVVPVAERRLKLLKLDWKPLPMSGN